MEVPAPSYSHVAASAAPTWKHARQPYKTAEICTKCRLFRVLRKFSPIHPKSLPRRQNSREPHIYSNENGRRIAFARPQKKLKVIHGSWFNWYIINPYCFSEKYHNISSSIKSPPYHCSSASNPDIAKQVALGTPTNFLLQRKAGMRSWSCL